MIPPKRGNPRTVSRPGGLTSEPTQPTRVSGLRFPPRESLLPNGISLFSIAGNSSDWTPGHRRFGPSAPPRNFGAGGFPCIFPADQGIRCRDGFALACTHRHLVCACGDRALGTRDRPGISLVVAGFGRTAKPNPNRRPRVSGPLGAAGRVRLCCQVPRFQFASDSRQRMPVCSRYSSYALWFGRGTVPSASADSRNTWCDATVIRAGSVVSMKSLSTSTKRPGASQWG